MSYLAPRGVDLIKTHDSVPTAAFVGLMTEANRAGIPVGGHIPFAAGSLEAARMGYRSIEHGRDLLYDCSSYGREYRRQEAAFVEGAPGSSRPTSLVRLRRTVAEFDAAACERLLQQLAATGVYYVPTHVTREMEARAREIAYRNDPARKYVAPDRNARWEEDLTETAALPDAEVEALGSFFSHGLRITALAHRAGIPVMAGTDSNDTMIVPGFSLHRELGLLQAAGLMPMDALRAATTVPAIYFRGADRLGGIRAGKEADLVLLSADPIADIAKTRTIEAVISNGRAFDRPALDALLAGVERMTRAPSL